MSDILLHKLNKYQIKLHKNPENAIYKYKVKYYSDLIGGKCDVKYTKSLGSRIIGRLKGIHQRIPYQLYCYYLFTNGMVGTQGWVEYIPQKCNRYIDLIKNNNKITGINVIPDTKEYDKISICDVPPFILEKQVCSINDNKLITSSREYKRPGKDDILMNHNSFIKFLKDNEEIITEKIKNNTTLTIYIKEIKNINKEIIIIIGTPSNDSVIEIELSLFLYFFNVFDYFI
jgi:hypothetical protein